MKRCKGFTLIELMIVVALLGILAMIGMGYYGDHVLSSNRTDARTALTQTAASLEKCRSLYGSYNHANCNADTAFTTDAGHYTISAPTLTGTTFVLNAAPQAGQTNDTDCDNLTYDNTGIKGATGTLPPADCW